MSKVIEVKTWEECCAEIEGIRRMNPAQASKLLFRGLSDSTWLLSTTLERRSGGRNFSFKDYYRLISRIRPEVETESGLRWDVPTFQEISSWAGVYDQTHYEMKAYEYLAHLRHNGFPSPLLDWSRSPYVAAYFAFSGAVSTTDAVAIYVYLERPEGMKVGGEGVPAIRTLGQYVRTHRRHFRQQSAYTVCANYQQDEFDRSYMWRFVSHQTVFDMHRPIQDLLWKIVVPSSERGKALILLDDFNLNAYSLFGSEESLMETLAYREIDRREALLIPT